MSIGVGVIVLSVVAGVAYLIGKSAQEQPTAVSFDQGRRQSQPAPKSSAVTPTVNRPIIEASDSPKVKPESAKPVLPQLPASAAKDIKPAMMEAPAGKNLTPEELFAKVAPAVVLIEVQGTDRQTIGSGTGFFVDDKGTLVTNAHVVLAEGAAVALVRLVDDTVVSVYEVEAVDREMDLAVLKVANRGASWIAINDAVPKVGQRVFALGNPMGLRHTLSEGLVSAVRPIGGRHSFIQTSAAISPGSSGGPLLDTQANAIGVTTLGSSGPLQNLNFAVPSSAIKELLARGDRPQKITSLVSNGAQPPQVIPVGKTDSLFGLEGVEVVVEGLHEEGRVAGLRESDIRAQVELRLRNAGVRVVSETERRNDPRQPYLYVNVATIGSPDLTVYGYVLSVRLVQVVALLIDTQSKKLEVRTNATTWNAPTIYGSVGHSRLAGTVAQALDKMVGEFTNDYLAANRKQ